MRLGEGQVLDGRYRLTHRIGSGGMADVWAAEDSELGRRVALKVLHENFARDREFVERFRREASAAAGLQHPNVVGVFDRGAVGDTYYIAMEHIDGSSLGELIDRGLEVPEAVEVARQILSAASFAHEHGIVHRDLKPMNVLVDRAGRIRVTDFGIARAGSSEITQTGSVMGTAQYLSPEQAQGLPVTAASDIYSIGVMLYEMLTGRVPFSGDSAVVVAMKQVSEQPRPPRELNPAIPPALEAVVLRSLAKDAANRYGSAAEMSTALDAAEADPDRVPDTDRFAAVPPAEQEEESKGRRRWLWFAAALAALLLLAAGAWALTRGGGVAVPEVTGTGEAEAVRTLEAAGFEVESSSVNSDVTEGEVVEQDPAAGSEADEGSTVRIEVSLGPAAENVPRVKGLSQRQALRKLRRRGFDNVEVRQEASNRVDDGDAIRTEPAAGISIVPTEPVTLVVSRGARTVTVPDVVGMSRTVAEATLEQEGFLVNLDPESSDAAEDEVIQQVPNAGSSAARGSEVTIIYSTGPEGTPDGGEEEEETVRLENFVGQRRSYAERRIRNQGLTVSVREVATDDRSEDGIVLEQAPPPGSRLSPGARVSLEVGAFERPDGAGSSGSER